jgi:hypothetical protein
VRIVRGECARQVRETLATHPRAHLFVKVPKKRGDAPRPFRDSKEWGEWVRETLKAQSERPWTSRGLTHAWATEHVCLDPGPNQTSTNVIETLAFHTGRGVRGLIESIKDGGADARAEMPPPPDLPPTLLVDPGDFPRPASLVIVETLHGGSADLSTFPALADALGHGDATESMRASLLAVAADASLPDGWTGLGTVHVVSGADSVDKLQAGQNAVFVDEDGGEHLSLVLTSGVRTTADLGAHASETVRTSLARWPRTYLFGDDGGAKPLRKDAFPKWAAHALEEVAGHRMTLFGLRIAMARCAAARAGE